MKSKSKVGPYTVLGILYHQTINFGKSFKLLAVMSIHMSRPSCHNSYHFFIYSYVRAGPSRVYGHGQGNASRTESGLPLPLNCI